MLETDRSSCLFFSILIDIIGDPRMLNETWGRKELYKTILFFEYEEHVSAAWHFLFLLTFNGVVGS